MKNNYFEWLQKWYIQQLDLWGFQGIRIGTIDNPGWSVKINLNNIDTNNHPFVPCEFNLDSDNDELNWYYCIQRNSNYEAAGGPLKLAKILECFRYWIENVTESFDDDKINFLQIWYLSNCDGDWEHEFGIEINTLKEHGWKVEMDLIDTNLENRLFNALNRQINEYNWIKCESEKNKFIGYGGPQNLSAIFEIFIQWAKE